MKFLKHLFLILPLAATLCAQDAVPAAAPAAVPAVSTKDAKNVPDTKVFDLIQQELSAYPHRLPGSKEYYESIDKLEKILKDNGIDVKRQSFPTLVPEVKRNVFKVDGKDVVISPFQPCGAQTVTTGPQPIEGGVIYLTDAELNKRYANIEGNIVFLEWGEHEYAKLLFTEGAKAVVFIGNNEATQWDIAKILSQYSLDFPFFYITRDEAKKHNLIGKYDKKRKASLSVITTWHEVEGINLWAEIKSNSQKIFSLNQPEAIFWGARLDTFGTVPGMVRSDRLTDNIALLGQTAVDFSKKELDRTIFVVFYGASYNAYDGLRYFYFPVSMRNQRNEPTLDDYAAGYQDELDDIQLYLETLAGNPITKKETTIQYKVRIMIRDAVVEHYNNINYRLADVNIEYRRLTKEIEACEDARLAAKLTAERDILEKEKDQLNKDKVSVSNIRRAVNEREIPEEYQDMLTNIFIKKVKEDLSRRENELQTMLKASADWKIIADATRPYALLAAYYFDFASDDQAFLFTTRTNETVHSNRQMDVSMYTKYFSVLSKLLPEMKMQQGKAHILPESLDVGVTPDFLSGLSLIYTPSGVALPMKLSSFTMRNIPGDYDADEMPGIHKYHLKGLLPVMDELFTTILQNPDFSMYSMLKDSRLLDAQGNYYYKSGSYFGKRFDFLGPDGKETTGPAAGAIATAGHGSYDRILPMAGFSPCALGVVNSAGYTSMPLLTLNYEWTQTPTFHPWRCFIYKFDENGRVTHINTLANVFKLFRCYGGTHVYNYAPLTSNFASCLMTANGVNDGKFTNTNGYHRVATGDGFLFVDKDLPVKVYWPDETHILNSQPGKPYGIGISFKPEDLLNLNASRIAVNNSAMINKDRLDKIHERNIFNSVIEGYQDRAEQHMIEAQKARDEGDINRARAHEIFGQTLAIRAYRPLKNLIDDLVKSVLILLILTIPFAFALERLLIGSANVYKQMGWILVFFLATFLLLYFTHPAFVLSQAPLIIFIAFFIITLSLVVIYIVMNRFKSELMALQGLDTSAHRNQSENSMILAAILIGVSSMKNRPVKTFLTILTVLLLTFTIISFASFDSTGYVRPTYIGDSSGEVRIESFLGNHLDVLHTTSQAVKDMFAKDYNIYYRSASYHNPFYMMSAWPTQENRIYNPNAPEKKTLEMEAVVGFEPEEAAHCSKLQALMPKLNLPETKASKIPGVYLATTTAEQLGLKEGDTFYLRSMLVRLDGIFDPAKLDEFTYLDDGKVSPPNFKATAQAEETGAFKVLNDTYVDSSNFIWSAPDVTVLTDYQTALKVNGFLNGVILYPKDGHYPDLIADATKIAEISFGIVYSNTANGINRHFYTQGYVASGLSTVLVPLLLGALIILSSLLGSIADREREIYTFSALGLSPKDVSVLFFAESGVYAVIGGLGGYLLSQLTTSVMNFLAKKGLMEAPEINYSSMTTIYTILIVMAIVMLSTIYPAIKAGRSANPDVARKWKMPPPDGNNLTFQFPFTVSAIDFGGILMFIGEHFENHSDSSLGSFAASNVRITHGQSDLTDGYMLSTNLTLAPFDLGVSEEFNMYSAPSDIEGISVVTVNIVRLDGSQGAWLRGNQRFVDEIRTQFLFWRSLPVETVMHYRELAENKLKNK